MGLAPASRECSAWHALSGSKTLLAIYIIAAILCLAGSGHAGMMSPLRLPVLLSIPLVVVHILVVMFWYIFVPPTETQNKTLWPLLSGTIGFFVLIGSMFLGLVIDHKLTEMTKNKGNEIRAELQAYYDQNGSCPETLSSIYPGGAPTTFLRNSEFSYFKYESGLCGLSFDAPQFITCFAFGLKDDWHCED